ncbi:MAG TPA: helix-turn-helix transcriptional regulator [Solirubrobacteraceae bacterium]
MSSARENSRCSGLVATGKTNSEIAGELIIGETTVKTHVTRILMKLGVRDRVQAVVLAYETRLVVQASRQRLDQVTDVKREARGAVSAGQQLPASRDDRDRSPQPNAERTLGSRFDATSISRTLPERLDARGTGVAPATVKPGRYTPGDDVLAYLEGLG